MTTAWLECPRNPEGKHGRLVSKTYDLKEAGWARYYACGCKFVSKDREVVRA